MNITIEGIRWLQYTVEKVHYASWESPKAGGKRQPSKVTERKLQMKVEGQWIDIPVEKSLDDRE